MNKLIAIALLALLGGAWYKSKAKGSKSPDEPEKPKTTSDPLPPAGGSSATATSSGQQVNCLVPPCPAMPPVLTVQNSAASAQAVNTSGDFLAQRKKALIKTMASIGLPQTTVAAIAEKIMAMSDSEVGTMEGFLNAIGTHQPLSKESYAAIMTLNTKYGMFPVSLLAQMQPK